MFRNLLSISDNVPKGVKILTVANAVRYFGWGLGEALLPIFIYQFAHSYSETGIIGAMYGIGFLLTIPLLGLLQDHVPTKWSLLLGLCMYPLVGTSYFFAGITGAIIFIVFAKFINGVGYALFQVGSLTYIKRNASANHIATNTSYFFSVSMFMWIAAAICSIPYLHRVPIHWLLFAVVPTHIIAIGILFFLNKDNIEEKATTTLSIVSTYFSHLKQKLLHHHTHAKRVYELKHRGVFLMTAAVFLMRVAVSVSGFLLPLYVFEQNKNILEVVLMAIIVSIPVMFTVFFGNWVDKNPIRSFVFSFTILLPVVLGLAMMTGYYTTLILAFSMMMVLEIISIGIQSITTNITPQNHYGSVTTLMSATENIGDMMGPLLLGVGMDMLGIKNSLFGLVAILSLFLIMILISKSHLKTEMLTA